MNECDLIEAILNGDSVDFEPKTNTQAYLKACVNQEGCSGLPEPGTRKSALLYRLAQALASGGGSLSKCLTKEHSITNGVDATTSEAVIDDEFATAEIPASARIVIWTCKVKERTSGYLSSLNLYVKNTSNKFSGLYSFAVKDDVAKSISGVSGLYAALEAGEDNAWGISLCAKKAATLTGDFNTTGSYTFELYTLESKGLTEVFQSVLGI